MAVASYTGMATMLDSIQEEFWKPPVLTAICVLALGLLMSGHLVWMLERKDNSKQFHRSYLDGVDDGVWWSFVTMATVGYGDKVPLTMTGRFIACLWMCIGILLFAVFNSAILLSMTSVTQARDISGFRDERLLLSGNTTICTVPNGLTEFLLQSNGLQPVTIFADSLKGCFQKMKKAAVKLPCL